MSPRRPAGRSLFALVAVVASLAAAVPASGRLTRPGLPPAAAGGLPAALSPSPWIPFQLTGDSGVLRTPTPAHPLRVVLLGDGVLFDAAPAIEAALRAAGPVAVSSRPVLGFGLTRPDWHDWRATWPRLMASERPDLVVLLVGPWDVRTLVVGGRALAPGTPTWAAWYRGIATEAAAILRAGGARLLWLGMPWNADRTTRPRTAALNTVIRQVSGTGFVDLARALGDAHGAYRAVQVEHGAPVRIMKADGVHLCPAGAARVARAVLSAAAALWRLRVTTAWQSGPWRSDQRYSWAPGGGCPTA